MKKDVIDIVLPQRLSPIVKDTFEEFSRLFNTYQPTNDKERAHHQQWGKYMERILPAFTDERMIPCWEELAKSESCVFVFIIKFCLIGKGLDNVQELYKRNTIEFKRCKKIAKLASDLDREISSHIYHLGGHDSLVHNVEIFNFWEELQKDAERLASILSIPIEVMAKEQRIEHYSSYYWPASRQLKMSGGPKMSRGMTIYYMRSIHILFEELYKKPFNKHIETFVSVISGKEYDEDHIRKNVRQIEKFDNKAKITPWDPHRTGLPKWFINSPLDQKYMEYLSDIYKQQIILPSFI